jgi:hypothetical protein
MQLKKGDKVIYVGQYPYGLSNGQNVKRNGEELVIMDDIIVQDGFFEKVEIPVEEKVNKGKETKKTLDK